MCLRTRRRKAEDLGGAHRPSSGPLSREPLVAECAPRAVGAAFGVSMHEGGPRRAGLLTEAFGGPEQSGRQARPVRTRESLQAPRLEHRVAKIARDLEPLRKPQAGRRMRALSGGDVTQSAHPAQGPPAITELAKLGQGFLEQRIGAFQVTVGESHPAETLRRAGDDLASAKPTRHVAALLEPGACQFVVTLNPQHTPQRLERAANARLVIEPPVCAQSLF